MKVFFVIIVLSFACKGSPGPARFQPATEKQFAEELIGWVNQREVDSIFLRWAVERESEHRKLLSAAIIVLYGQARASEEVLGLRAMASRYSENEKKLRLAEIEIVTLNIDKFAKDIKKILASEKTQPPKYLEAWASGAVKPWRK